VLCGKTLRWIGGGRSRRAAFFFVGYCAALLANEDFVLIRARVRKLHHFANNDAHLIRCRDRVLGPNRRRPPRWR